MSNWEDFATSSSISPSDLTVAEDRRQIRSADDYALFQEMTFLKVADYYQVVPPSLNKNKVFDIKMFPMVSFKNHTLRKRKFYFKYGGFEKISVGAVIVEETANPTGYRIIRLWNGEYPLFRTKSEWISWRQAVTNTFE